MHFLVWASITLEKTSEKNRSNKFKISGQRWDEEFDSPNDWYSTVD